MDDKKNLEKAVYGLLMDDDLLKRYSNIVETYNQAIASNPDMKEEAKKKYKENAKNLINQEKQRIREEASEIIEDYKESKQFKFPEKPDPTLKNDKILQETKRNTEIVLLREEIKATEDPKELVNLAREYEEDGLMGPDVDRLIKSELRKRGETSYIERLENSRKPDLSGIEGIKSAVNLMTNENSFTVVNPTADDGIKPEYRNIDKDLKKGNTPTKGSYKRDILQEIKGGE